VIYLSGWSFVIGSCTLPLRVDENNFFQKLIVSDEAIFSLNSEVNTHNVIQYQKRGQGHPEEHYIDFEQRADKIMVWTGLTGEGLVIGPYFIEGKMDTREYLRIVRYNVIQRDFRRLNINRRESWWQKDNALPYQQSINQISSRSVSCESNWFKR